VLRLPFTRGEATTLLVFSGWLRTDRGTVILVGSLPCRGGGEGSWGVEYHAALWENTEEDGPSISSTVIGWEYKGKGGREEARKGTLTDSSPISFLSHVTLDMR